MALAFRRRAKGANASNSQASATPKAPATAPVSPDPDEELLELDEELLELDEELDELLELELEELELELELELLDELLELDELVEVPVLTPGQPRIILATNLPDSVKLPSLHPPVAFAPTVKNEAPSALSFKAQLAWLILLERRKFIQVLVSPEFTAPLPSALTAPHSVTNNAMPRSRAVWALARNSPLWVPA